MITGHGDDFQRELKANFSSNIWYGADNSALYEHLYQQIPNIHRYPEPDGDSLKMALANHHDIIPAQIALFNGSVEAIYRIAQIYAQGTSLIIAPTFSEYNDACSVYQHTIHSTKSTQLVDSIEKIKPNLVWICNPNNPDGYCFQASELLKIIGRFENTHFIVDQAFAEFSLNDPIFAKQTCNHKNLLLIHSMTKRHGIAGLRLGYVIASEQITKEIEKFRIPWSINSLAIEAGKFLLNLPDTQFDLTAWIAEKSIFQQEIESIEGFETLPSQTPFFLVRLLKGTSTDLKEFLLRNDILIRNANNFVGLSGEMIRLNTLSKHDNNLLLFHLKEWNNTTHC